MSETQVSKSNTLLTFLGGLGAILIFALILFIAYLPNRPAAVNAQVNATRQQKADEARAAGIQKLTNYEVIDAAAGTARIPIEDAMKLTVARYESNVGTEPAVAEPAAVEEPAAEPVVAAEPAEEATVEEPAAVAEPAAEPAEVPTVEEPTAELPAVPAAAEEAAPAAE